jgi:hypothetical protein
MWLFAPIMKPTIFLVEILFVLMDIDVDMPEKTNGKM